MITQRRQQIEAQAKAFTPIAVSPAQDAKHLEASQSVFHDHALARQLPVVSFLFRRERMELALFVWRLAVGMPTVQTPIAGISQTATLFTQPQTATFEQPEVMRVAGTKSRRQNSPAVLFDHDLGFQGGPGLSRCVASSCR